MAEIGSATRSAALALADERALMRQGHRFLDEKRMLLAAELLRLLREHDVLQAQVLAALQRAREAMQRALRRHGLDALQAMPPGRLDASGLVLQRAGFLGIATQTCRIEREVHCTPAAAVDASPQALACGDAFAALVAPLALLAVCRGNLERLGAEYRRTERRARALENVLLPEIERALATIDERLDAADQEEAVRIRLAGRRG